MMPVLMEGLRSWGGGPGLVSTARGAATSKLQAGTNGLKLVGSKARFVTGEMTWSGF